MRYFKFSGGTGYCGMDFEEYQAWKDEDVTEEALEEEAQSLANDNAASYESSDLCEEDFETLEDFEEALAQESEDYWADVYGNWEEVSEEEYNEYKED